MRAAGRIQGGALSLDEHLEKDHYNKSLEYDDTSLLKMVLLNSNKGNAQILI